MRIFGVVRRIVPDVVGTSTGPVGFDIDPVQSPNRVLHLLNALLSWHQGLE